MKVVLIPLVLICLTTSCNVGGRDSEKKQEDNTSSMKAEEKAGPKLAVPINQDLKLIANKHFQLNITLDLTSFAEKLDDGCDIANNIRKDILVYLRNQSGDKSLGEEFMKLLDENRKLDCSYPRDDNELNLLYAFSQKLLISSEKDNYSVKLLFSLRKYFSDVLEFSEHLQFVIPQVALINTSGFVETLSTCDMDEQDRIIDLLQFFDNKTAIEAFKSNLSEVTNYEDIVSNVRNYIIAEFGE